MGVAALAVAALAAGCGSSAGSSVSGEPRLVAIGHGLEGPAGLVASVYATGLPTASAFAFDSRGWLWVTTSAASGHARDGVYLIRRAGSRPVEVVADIKGPLGLVWYEQRLYVTSLGRVDVFSGLHGNRFARRRQIVAEPAGHGWNDSIVVAPSGRLVMSISSACDHCRSRSPWSATIVSFRPDGSDVRVDARGIRAGYGLAYLPGTSTLLVSMNQRDDLGARTPGDWLAIVRRGQDWRFPACYGQAGAACRGVPAPLAVLDQHAAAGAVAVVGGQLGPKVGNVALVSEWALGKVQSVALRSSATTARGTVTPFLSRIADPLALMLAPDGALLVGDWKTGVIYRVARRGS